MVGSATLTMLVSRIDMNIPTMSTPRAGSHDAAGGPSPVSAEVGVGRGCAPAFVGCGAAFGGAGRAARPLPDPADRGSGLDAIARPRAGPAPAHLPPPRPGPDHDDGWPRWPGEASRPSP
jgi:hypothetical protein